MTKEQQVTTASGLNIIAGLWLIISPFVLGYSSLTAATWGSIIVGIIIAAIAAVRAFCPGEMVWLSWVNVVLGSGWSSRRSFSGSPVTPGCYITTSSWASSSWSWVLGVRCPPGR
jgi:hypothetical protein